MVARGVVVIEIAEQRRPVLQASEVQHGLKQDTACINKILVASSSLLGNG